MEDSKARTWKKIALFYALTLCFSGVFDGLIIRAGSMDVILYVTGAMWSPALAAFATKAIFGESIRTLPWKWGNSRYPFLGYVIPIAYALPVYLIVWLCGLGGFIGADFIKETEKHGLSSGLALTLFVLLTATFGLVGKTSRALGEEIGWRGFLVPELAKVVGFSGVGIISGLMWAVYHFPVLLFGGYNAGTSAWYGLPCFTIMVVADSFIMAWLTLRSGSLWPAAILHGSHNLFIQSIFTPLTRDTGPTRYIIDEFGIGLALTTTITAIVLWWRCRVAPVSEMKEDMFLAKS